MKITAAAVLLTGVALSAMAASVSGQEPATESGATDSDRLAMLMKSLGASDFDRRATASKQLKQLTADDIRTLASMSVEQPSAEVIIRLLAEVDARYASEDDATVRAASEALESLSESTRIVLAESANDSLRRHWQTRIELAVRELEKNGAHVKYGSFAPTRDARWLRQPAIGTVNILIDESWHGDAGALKIFGRLSALVGQPMGVRGGLRVYLLDGHPLDDRQRAELAEFVGQEIIAERSRVALGITPQAISPGRGVVIGTVSKGSTAAAANLQPGDLILALTTRIADPDGEPAADANLRDFDDLVERLKKFRPGDSVVLTVIRDYRAPAPAEELIEVKLKGWRELQTEVP